jgi:hypothetical protein
MIRVNHFLPKPQVQALKSLAKKTGLSLAELIRRAVELYLKQETKPGT